MNSRQNYNRLAPKQSAANYSGAESCGSGRHSRWLELSTPVHLFLGEAIGLGDCTDSPTFVSWHLGSKRLVCLGSHAELDGELTLSMFLCETPGQLLGEGSRSFPSTGTTEN